MEKQNLDLSINFEYYKVFYVVAKKGNLTKAAQELFISQPAVTQTINKLEDELGEKLFLRDRKGMRLTAFGTEVFTSLEKGVLSLSQIKKDAESFGGLKKGKVVIGAGTHITKAILIDAIKKFNQHYCGVSFKIIDNKKDVMFDLLASGNIDFFVSNNMYLEEDKFNFIPLFEDARVFVASPDYIKQNPSITFESCMRNECITLTKGSSTRQELEEFAEKQSLKLTPKMEVEGYSTIVNMAISGVGVAFLPKFLIKQELLNKQLQIINFDIKVEKILYGIIANKNYTTKPAKVFIDTVIELLKEGLV